MYRFKHISRGAKYSCLPIIFYDGLPNGYTKLEYLQCNGGYINTHLTGINGVKIKCKWDVVANNSNMFGARKGANNRFELMIYNGVFHQVVNGGGPNTGAANNQIHTFEMGTQVNGDVLMDGIKRTSINGLSYGSSYETLLFATNEAGSPTHGCYGKIWYVRFYRFGNLIGHLIPARRDGDGVLGMYDIHNKRFLTGSNLVAGPEVWYEIR